MLDHDSPVPLHEQLTAILRGQIQRRELTGRVPSILTLAQEHEVSHRTAARALTTLRDEGLIISVTGMGYYVRLLKRRRPPVTAVRRHRGLGGKRLRGPLSAVLPGQRRSSLASSESAFVVTPGPLRPCGR